MIIGIDMDGVLSDDDRYRLDHYAKYNYLHGLKGMDTPYGYEDKCSDWTHEIFDDYINEFELNYYENAAMFTFADEITQKLHEEGHKIVIITGRHIAQQNTPRGEFVRKASEQWLKKNNIYFDKLVFSPWPKIQSIRDNHVDCMIEDYTGTIETCRQEMPVILFDNRYNVGYEAENVYRVFSWYEIYNTIHKLDEKMK